MVWLPGRAKYTGVGYGTTWFELDLGFCGVGAGLCACPFQAIMFACSLGSANRVFVGYQGK